MNPPPPSAVLERSGAIAPAVDDWVPSSPSRLSEESTFVTRLLQSGLAGFSRAVTGARVQWPDAGPPSVGGQRVYFANHCSHADFMLVWSSLPTPVRQRTFPVGAADYWTAGRMRRYFGGQVFKMVMIDRSPNAAQTRESRIAAGREAVFRMTEALGSQHSLIIFPEGTRGSGDEVGSFKSGLYHLCKARPDLELVPVYLENLSRVLPKGEFLPVPCITRVIFGSSLRMERYEERDGFLDRMRSSLLQLAPE